MCLYKDDNYVDDLVVSVNAEGDVMLIQSGELKWLVILQNKNIENEIVNIATNEIGLHYDPIMDNYICKIKNKYNAKEYPFHYSLKNNYFID